MTPAIILVRPRSEGNIGMVARAMANMGFRELVVVEPAAELGGTARGFGVGGWHILDDCLRVPSFAEAIAPYQRVMGTASARERPLSEWRVLDARQAASEIAASPDVRTALVFGQEDTGLTRDELNCCHPIITVPCHAEHPTLNLAQAVLLTTYEVSQALDLNPAPRDRPPVADAATAGEIETLFGKVSPLLHQLGYDHAHLHAALLNDLRRLAQRSTISSREVRIFQRLVNRAAGRVSGPAE